MPATRLSNLCAILAFAALPACGRSAGAALASHTSWDTESPTDVSKSTHLWIVNQALAILATHRNLPPAAAAVVELEAPDCRTAWQQGLYDADFLAKYNGGRFDLSPADGTLTLAEADPTWAQHFYDPDTQQNYLEDGSANALTATLAHVEAASPTGDKASRNCYELGLALHFYTDITQPMHASNFTALARPRGLHSDLESYAMTIQSRYGVDTWGGIPDAPDLQAFIISSARQAKAEWPSLQAAVAGAYTTSSAAHSVECGSLSASAFNLVAAQEIDHPLCWSGQAGIDAGLGASLAKAQMLTAQFMYLLERG